MACSQLALVAILLLPNAVVQAQVRHLSGIVVDADGGPVAEAAIDHTGARSTAALKSGADGHFDVEVYSPAVVIRKPGYRSAFLLTDHASPGLRIVLAKLDRQFPACSPDAPYVDLEGRFRFPIMDGIRASKPVSDADYQALGYFIQTDEGPKGIVHGSGPMWTLGEPIDTDVWQSTNYREDVFDTTPPILDAGGDLTGGYRWRYLGMPGESASFAAVDRKTADVLDRFLDGACLTPRRTPGVR